MSGIHPVRKATGSQVAGAALVLGGFTTVMLNLISSVNTHPSSGSWLAALAVGATLLALGFVLLLREAQPRIAPSSPPGTA